MARDSRAYGLSPKDRESEICRKFGVSYLASTLGILDGVLDPTEQVLGAIVFLARDGHPEEIGELTALANANRQKLLHAASVKDERG
jgi:hypothetical protein